ncbi:YqaA family protein [Bordetella genomosp. 13]|uniref:YqaA family protein n=1 Tax=Bordetella genomosp. 13 TaxID=463040 RepID=UPI0011A507EB|nr:YqaA family protein [Bordetella genomosp. 13]
MEQTLLAAIHTVLGWLALPEVGLSAIFVVSFVSATLLPLGSEPAVYAYVKVSPDMFWPAILVATLANTLGGVVNYAMGLGAHRGVERWRERHGHEAADAAAPGASSAAPKDPTKGRWHAKARDWLTRLGPPALLLAWLPVVGDPMCAVAGWLRLSFWPCVVFMAIGKFLRYITMTAGLLWATSGVQF